EPLTTISIPMNILTITKSKSGVRKARKKTTRRFPGGKALKRIEYFETQRALSRTRLVRGFVTSESLSKLRISRKPSTRGGSKPDALYLKADRAKERLVPKKFAAA